MDNQLDVLIVEDNEADSEILRRYLEDLETFDLNTMAVQTHHETLDTVDNNDFDVIFVDYKLPDRSGLNTTSELRNRGINVPVVMLTGQGSERLAAISMREGVDDYLTKKDLTPTNLEYSINHVLSEHQREEELKERLNDLKKKSEIDELTGLNNRRAFKARLREEMKRTSRYETNLSLMMLDLDNFKEINDRYGHVTGDKVLETAAWTLLENIREPDFLARYGGDEFCVIVTGSDVDQAVKMARRISERTSELSFDSIDDDIECSFSIGIAEYSREVGEDIEAYLHEVDKAMYLAKEIGSNSIFTVRKSERSPGTVRPESEGTT